ncbi:unnamed protein product, partial [Pocillopora meandrina]
MRGSLPGLPGCREFVLKILNDRFSVEHGYICSTPVKSILKTHFVKCKIPRIYQPSIAHSGPVRVSIATDQDSNGISLETGEVLNEIPLNTQLLFTAEKVVGSMDRNLKDFVYAKLERPNFSWDLSRVDEKIQPCPEAVTDPHHVEMVREVCEAFRKNVKPKLHLLPKQIIHGDPNYTNLVFSSLFGARYCFHRL